MFRLPEHQALINRMGFNNHGMCTPWLDRLHRLRASGRLVDTLLGVNLGKNKNTSNDEAASDYLQGMDCLHGYADYFTVNLSSPNTPNLRQLARKPLRVLLSQVKERQMALAGQSVPVPVLLKVALIWRKTRWVRLRSRFAPVSLTALLPQYTAVAGRRGRAPARGGNWRSQRRAPDSAQFAGRGAISSGVT